MANKYENLTALQSAVFDINSAADKATFTIPFKCRIYRAQIHHASTDAGGCTIKFDSTVSGASRGDGDVAVIVTPASNCQGKVYYDIAERGDIYDEGDIVTVEVTAEGGSAGYNAYATLIVDYIPEVEGNSTNMVETA